MLRSHCLVKSDSNWLNELDWNWFDELKLDLNWFEWNWLNAVCSPAFSANFPLGPLSFGTPKKENKIHRYV